MIYLRTLTKAEREQCRLRTGIVADLSAHKGPGVYQDETGYWAVYQCGPFGLRQFYLVIKGH